MTSDPLMPSRQWCAGTKGKPDAGSDRRAHDGRRRPHGSLPQTISRTCGNIRAVRDRHRRAALVIAGCPQRHNGCSFCPESAHRDVPPEASSGTSPPLSRLVARVDEEIVDEAVTCSSR